MSRIAIIGGHGKVALRLARLLTDRGDQVGAFIRNPDHVADVEAAGATAVMGDVENLTTGQIAALLDGYDAVVWSAGAGGGNPARTYAVDRDAAIRSMDAAAAAGVRRYVMVSALSTRTDHGVAPDDPYFPYAESKAAADEYLRSTELEWTILGPGGLTLNPGTGRIAVGDEIRRAHVTRDDVAAVAAQVLAAPATAGTTINFTNGDTPIAEAIRGLT
jgi:nucleoside-diphosphate-sugar epimerase